MATTLGLRTGQRHPFMECEYIGGGTVQARIESRSVPTDPSELRAFLSGLLAGIDEMHELGIIHRDIKPANVGFRDATWGYPVLLDFGLARVLDMTQYTAYPARIGTDKYMAPEQLRGEPARTRSDMFAAAAIVYESGTGKHPYLTEETTSVQALHDRMAQVAVDDPRTLNYAWPDDVASVVTRLLSYHPHERLPISRAIRDLENL